VGGGSLLPVKLDDSTVDDLVYSFTALFAERTIEEQPSDLAQYGLVPRARWRAPGWTTAR